MDISLDDIHKLLDRQMDEGSTFSRLRCIDLKQRNKYSWGHSRLNSKVQQSEASWILESLYSGTWGVLRGNSFQELVSTASRSSQLAKEVAKKTNNKSSRDIMMSKPIRQITSNKLKESHRIEEEDLLLLLEQIDRISPGNLNLKLQDDHISSHYWDTEHTRGVNEFTNLSIDLAFYPKNENYPIAWRNYYHSNRLDSMVTINDLNWQEDIKNWVDHMQYEKFRGPAADDLPWVFSPKAFAQLIYGTLRKTFCSESPDPFCENMNPATLEGEQLTASGLTLISSPPLYSASSFLDQEGVPAKKIILLDNGILKNFLFTRISAFQLSRSLSVHKEKILSGSGRSFKEGLSVHPDMMYIEALPNEDYEDKKSESHVYIDELDVEPLDLTGMNFLIRIRNAFVTKYGGLHKRHIKELRFFCDRNKLWSNFMGCSEDQKKIFLSPDGKFNNLEPYSVFLVPEAQFEGFPCTWS